MRKMIEVFMLITISLAVYGQEFNCFPKNKMKLPVNSKSLGASLITELSFHQIIDEFQAIWEPVVKDHFGKTLIIRRDWSHPKVNAHATRDVDNNPVIVILGGLARHGEMTRDGLFLILCHELGHHYGGAPKSFRGRSKRRSWSSAEGQSDYFAASKCMPKILESEYNLKFDPVRENKLNAINIDELCRSDHCRRISLAALSVGRVFASLKYDWIPPSPIKKSHLEVVKTFYKHPSPQCRFDTFLAGVNCESAEYFNFDNSDHKIGSCLRDENPAGARPSCWFTANDY